ncbi:MAG: DMT family transporter [Burkholderiales bacterium]
MSAIETKPDATTPRHPVARALVPMAALALLWGCNWPILKLAIGEIPPLTFRMVTLVFAGLGLLALARASGDPIAIPRTWWPRLAVLAFFNITVWNGLVLFGLKELPAGRSVILGHTMPVWATLLGVWLAHEPANRRKLAGLALGMLGMALLIGEDLGLLRRRPFGAAMILGSSFAWAIGTVLLRKWKPPFPLVPLSGWMMVVGWLPLALLAPFFDDVHVGRLASASWVAWLGVLYNIALSGTLGHWAWFTLARTLPSTVAGLSSLPVPVVGVFASMIVLGERPGAVEWAALACVVGALAAVLWPQRGASA